jgi:hypothetical protein
MNPAVDRLLDERERQGRPRHVEDDAVIAAVAQLLNADDAGRSRRRPEPDHGRHRDLRAV